ncbi:MAG TPA: hypothetical protein VGE52_03435 [Pirellulales bacterium]
MPRWILLDEFHVQVSAPQRFSPEESDAARAALDRPVFRRRLLQAVRDLADEFPELQAVQIRVAQ